MRMKCVGVTRSANDLIAVGVVPNSTKAVTAAWSWSRSNRNVRGDKARGRVSVANGSETAHQTKYASFSRPKESRKNTPIDPVGRAERRNRHSRKAKRGIGRNLIPDQRNLSVQRFRPGAQRLRTNRRDELSDQVIIDVFGAKPTGACIARHAGEADLDLSAQMPFEQLEPGAI